MNTPDKTQSETTAIAKYTLGLDLGDRQHGYCKFDHEGEILSEEQLPNDRVCHTHIRL